MIETLNQFDNTTLFAFEIAICCFFVGVLTVVNTVFIWAHINVRHDITNHRVSELNNEFRDQIKKLVGLTVTKRVTSQGDKWQSPRTEHGQMG